MKRSTSVLVVFVLSVIASLFGQSTKTEFNALVAKRVTFNADFQKDQEGKPSLASQVNALHVQQKAYDAAFAKHNEWAKNPPSLAERNAHDAEAARLTPLVNAQIAKVTALLARVRDYKQRLAAHNANRCYYPPNNPSYCDGYNKEQEAFATEAANLTAEGTQLDQLAAQYNGQKAELDAQKDRFDAENARIAADAKVVDQQGAELNAAIAVYKTNKAPWLKIWLENEASIEVILGTLKANGVQVDACQTALQDTRDSAQENIRTVCGTMFK